MNIAALTGSLEIWEPGNRVSIGLTKRMNISVYNFELKALKSLRLAAFGGPAFRGGFEAVLRQLKCVTGLLDCAGCPVSRDCPVTD